MTELASLPSGRSPSRPALTAAVINLGCKVNQSEMEAASRVLRQCGVRVLGDRARADLYLVNTCTVTSIADAKSRQAVRRARRLNPAARIVVAGCSVGVDPGAFAAVDPAAHLVNRRAGDSLLAELEALVGLPEQPTRPLDRALPTIAGVEIEGVADGRTLADRTRAFIKVQDGCSFFCTYCIIPQARGPERSLAPETVLADVRRAVAAGHREVVLTGINIGTYDGGRSERGPRGSHARSALTLAGLVRRIRAETDVERVRISSIEPQHVDAELLEAWVAGAPRTLPHFHLPLQSGDDAVLRRMGRRYDTAFYGRLVERIRAAIPGVAIHADVIAGFPTEDEAAHERSLAFIRALDPAGLHVFRYSARPGTPAERMAGAVSEPTKKRRAADLLALSGAARARFAARAVGRQVAVLFEERLPDGRWLGHAEDHVLVAARSPDDRPLENAIGRVVITGRDPGRPDRVVGRLIGVSWPEPPAGRSRRSRDPPRCDSPPGREVSRESS